MRVFMGVHKHAPLLGIIGDMGWIPNVLHRNIEYIRYWNRIIKMDDNRITKSVLIKITNVEILKIKDMVFLCIKDI